MTRKRPPSYYKYRETHPTIQITLTDSLKAIIDERKGTMSYGKYIKKILYDSIPSENAMQEQYDEGKREGYIIGYAKGLDLSRKEGYEDGRLAGYDEGFQKGYEQGLSEGNQKGLNENQTIRKNL